MRPSVRHFVKQSYVVSHINTQYIINFLFQYEVYSSDSEASSERQTDLSYYTSDTSDLTVTPPPPPCCQCGTSECSTLLGRETNV